MFYAGKRILTGMGYSSRMPTHAIHNSSSIIHRTRSSNCNALKTLSQANWVTVAIGCLIAITILTISGFNVAVRSAGPLAFLTATLISTQIFYTQYRSDERIAGICGLLAVLIAASFLAAIISHTGLRLGFSYVDRAFSEADRMLGIHAPTIVLKIAEYPAFASVLGVLYSSAMPICFVCGLALVASGKTAMAYEFAFYFVFCILMASTISIFFPALGSTVYHGIENTAGLPSGAGNFHLATVEYFRNDASAMFDLAKVDGIVTFPSFHMVMALLVPLALRETSFLFWIAALWAFLVTISAIVIGGHYVIDLLGGAVICATAAYWVRFIGRFSHTVVLGQNKNGLTP